MKRKLRENRGETLVEVMASIVICTLSVTLLFGSIMASSHIDQTAQTSDAAYYEALSAAEAQTALSEDGMPEALKTKTQVTITGSGMPKKIDVSFYGGEGMYSYGKKPAAGGGP